MGLEFQFHMGISDIHTPFSIRSDIVSQSPQHKYVCHLPPSSPLFWEDFVTIFLMFNNVAVKPVYRHCTAQSRSSFPIFNFSSSALIEKLFAEPCINTFSESYFVNRLKNCYYKTV